MLEFSEEELQDLMNQLLEIPAKYSINIVLKLSEMIRLKRLSKKRIEENTNLDGKIEH